MSNPFHPELRASARWLRLLPPIRVIKVLDRVHARRPVPAPPRLADVDVRDLSFAARDGQSLRLRLYRPAARAQETPLLLWIHGGGLVIGSPEQDEASNLSIVRKLGIAVAAVRYRLAPEWPFPTPLEDGYSALSFLHAQAEALGLARSRIAVGGASAGGGLAAALTQLAHDRGELPIAFQLLIYPMLDDRSAMRADIDRSQLRMWSQRDNVYGWSAYLGHAPGQPELRPYAVPARRAAFEGLPPAWLGVGSCDLFHDEGVAYAAQLTAAGVACELHVVPGAYHAFDLAARAAVVRTFRASYLAALQRALYDAT